MFLMLPPSTDPSTRRTTDKTTKCGRCLLAEAHAHGLTLRLRQVSEPPAKPETRCCLSPQQSWREAKTFRKTAGTLFLAFGVALFPRSHS